MRKIPTMEFKRGATLGLVVRLPPNIQDGFFTNWDISSQIRRHKNNTLKGFIADLNATWIESPDNNMVLIHHSDTTEWPLGLAEFDLKFTSPTGTVVKSVTVSVNITDGVTK